jgi:predicted metal-dependent peptidase
VSVFDWIHDNRVEPDALVYLTDGEGRFPSKAPAFPVIWGNILQSSKYPFGDVVDIPKQA